MPLLRHQTGEISWTHPLCGQERSNDSTHGLRSTFPSPSLLIALKFSHMFVNRGSLCRAQCQPYISRSSVYLHYLSRYGILRGFILFCLRLFRANSSISAMRPPCYYLLEKIVILGVIYGSLVWMVCNPAAPAGPRGIPGLSPAVIFKVRTNSHWARRAVAASPLHTQGDESQENWCREDGRWFLPERQSWRLAPPLYG